MTMPNLLKRNFFWVAALILLSLFGAGFSSHATARSAHYQIWGYSPYWMKDGWQKIDLALFDQVLFFEIPVSVNKPFLQTNGWPGDWQGLTVAAKKNGACLQPVFTLFDAKAFERIFSSRTRRDILQADMLALVDGSDSCGVQLDFEIFGAVSGAASDGYRLFVKSMKGALADRKKILSLFVLTEDSAGLYNANVLSFPDYIVIQGYDAHWKGSVNAGPVAELHGNSPDSWDASLRHYLSLGVPRSKILMSVPYFGYEWPTLGEAAGALSRGEGSEISYSRLPTGLVPAVTTCALDRIGQYGMRRDPVTGSPYYVYRNETGWFQGWFEDEVSLSGKFEFVKKEHLAGVAVFSLGYDGGHFETLLRRYFRP